MRRDITVKPLRIVAAVCAFSLSNTQKRNLPHHSSHDMYQMKKLQSLESLLLVAFLSSFSIYPALADEPKQGDAKNLDLGNGVGLELVYIPPGKFMMGSTAAEKEWATGIEGGAKPGTVREKYEGEPRPMRVSKGFWMGRTEVTMGQFRRFVEETGYVTDAEKPGG